MKSGVCPKCHGKNVHAGTEVPFKRGSHGSNSIPISWWQGAPLDNYICTDCGYVESYVADPDKLVKIAQVWPKAGRR